MRRICETLLTDAQAAATQAGRPVPRGVTCWTSRGLWHAAPAWNSRLPRPSPSAAPPWRRGSPRPSSSPNPPLLDNAHRYATRTIRVECVRRPDGVEVCVDDDGPGVPPAVANRSSKRVGAPTPATTTRAPGSACRGPGAWPARRHHTGRCPRPAGRSPVHGHAPRGLGSWSARAGRLPRRPGSSGASTRPAGSARRPARTSSRSASWDRAGWRCRRRRGYRWRSRRGSSAPCRWSGPRRTAGR